MNTIKQTHEAPAAKFGTPDCTSTCRCHHSPFGLSHLSCLSNRFLRRKTAKVVSPEKGTIHLQLGILRFSQLLKVNCFKWVAICKPYHPEVCHLMQWLMDFIFQLPGKFPVAKTTRAWKTSPKKVMCNSPRDFGSAKCHRNLEK